MPFNRVIVCGIGLLVALQSAQASPPNDPVKLLASDGSEGDEFGTDVGVSQGRAIVGARFNDDAGSNSGSAYLYDVSTGAQLSKLVAADAAAEDWFGISTAISGSTAVVGAYQSDARGIDSGAAYVFDATTGIQLRKLTANDGTAGDCFGITAAIDGTTAVFGAYLDNNRGSAYVFNTATGQQIRKLTAPDISTESYFGASVAISGRKALVGANADDALGSASGSAHLFDVDTGVRLLKLLPNDGRPGQQFGHAVALSGNRAIVSSPFFGAGSVYVFDTATGAQLYKLAPNDGESGDQFGISVALSGSLAIIGSYLDHAPQTYSGSAYIFDITTGKQLAKLTAPDGAAFNQFGSDVAIDGTIAIVGARADEDLGHWSGSAYAFAIPEPTALAMLLPMFGLVVAVDAHGCRRRRACKDIVPRESALLK